MRRIENEIMTMKYVFGPVPSRRLGLSLGVDLIPPKTCTFDCLYCEVGRTTERTLTPRMFAPFDEIIREVKERLQTCSPDVITLAGSGEPTLYADLKKVIDGIREITGIDVALLTNGSLFRQEEIVQRVLNAHIILPTLSSVFEDTFKKIHRPPAELSVKTVIDGLMKLRGRYHGRMYLEVILLAGINDSDEEIVGLKTIIDAINPDKIQLNTVVRPPADIRAKCLDMKRLKEIKVLLGPKAEIVVGAPAGREKKKWASAAEDFLDMVRRRPLTAADMARLSKMSVSDAESVIKGLLIKGMVRKREHSGEIFYLAGEENVG